MLTDGGLAFLQDNKEDFNNGSKDQIKENGTEEGTFL